MKNEKLLFAEKKRNKEWVHKYEMKGSSMITCETVY
jgi:hypothetical protein